MSARCGQPRINSTVSPPTSAVVLKDAGAANRMTSWHRHNGGGEMVRKRRSVDGMSKACLGLGSARFARARPCLPGRARGRPSQPHEYSADMGGNCIGRQPAELLEEPGVIAQLIPATTPRPASRPTVASVAGKYGRRSGQRAQTGSSPTAAAASAV